MSKDVETITLPRELIERVLAEMPPNSTLAYRLRDRLVLSAKQPRPEPVAYLAHRLTGKQAGKRFVTQPGKSYDPRLYRGPYPVYEGPEH